MITALIGFAAVILLCFFGIPIAFATLFVGFGGFLIERGLTPALTLLGSQVMENAANYNLSVIPLFVLMGAFIYRADISTDLYEAAYARLGTRRGGLAHSTVLACAGFSAVCGSSLATAATMTKVALPPMRRYGYSDTLATGTIAAGGTLGIMIPPSVPLVIYGIAAEQDIGRLFMAGIVPGLVLVLSFLLAIAVWTAWRPDLGPPGEPLAREQAGRALRAVLPILALFVLVIGGIYGGIFTPTEAAGVGATGAGLIALARGRMRSLAEWRETLVETATTSASLFAVVIGAAVFAQFVNLSRMPFDLVTFLQQMNLSPLGLVIGIAIIAIVMGMVFESLGIILLLVPVFLPSLIAAEVDLIWFGIIVVLVTELGLITPPIGMNVFIVKGVMPDTRMADIFRGTVPFIIAMLVVLALIIAVPPLATGLPDLMQRF